MWLLDTETLLLKYFSDDRKAVEARYAILSHTWGEDEVNFRDMTRDNFLDDFKRRKTKKKAGFAKIEKTCEQAKREGFRYAWIDTCCIDKESSAELSEAINSMYRWYADAVVCYAYLSDVTLDEEKRIAIVRATSDESEYLRSRFTSSRWFKRGWVSRSRSLLEIGMIYELICQDDQTLQELIAPADVRFYDSQWTAIDSKARMAPVISALTGIDESVLRQRDLVKNFSVATRMSWAASRQTTRVEDEAYSLLGLFAVNMPMIYGEGNKAFLRLQEEIIKISTDHSIFAWSASGEHAAQHPLLAPHARSFAGAGNITTGADVNLGDSYEMSNSGLRISLPAIQTGADFLAQLNCEIDGASVALRLRRHAQSRRVVTGQSEPRMVCEVDRFPASEEERAFQEPLDLEDMTDFMILRYPFSCGIGVRFDMSQGVQIAGPRLTYNNEVYLSASTPGAFSQAYVDVRMEDPPLQERLYFGQYLNLRNAGPTFRLCWGRGFDKSSPYQSHSPYQDDVINEQPLKAQQSSAHVIKGRLLQPPRVRFDTQLMEKLRMSELGPRFRGIDPGKLCARQAHVMGLSSEDYCACFEATASLHLKHMSTTNGKNSADNDVDLTAERVGLEAVFWKLSIKIIAWNTTASGECDYFVFDTLADRLRLHSKSNRNGSIAEKR